MNSSRTAGGGVWPWVILVIVLGLFYIHFNQKINELESELSHTRTQLHAAKEDYHQVVGLKEENIRLAVEQHLQKNIDSSAAKASQQVTSLQSEVRSRLDTLQNELFNEALSQVTNAMNNLTETVVSSFQKASSHATYIPPPQTSGPTRYRSAWLERIAVPEESDHVYINPEWKPTRGYQPVDEADKWIVLTSVNPPTDSIKKLCALEGWKTVIVADTKTPKDWHHEGCVFLSAADQNALPYKIIRYLPWKNYARKNIGFLYAIEHGAKWVLDTDDDNEPFGDEITVLDINQKFKLLDRGDRREGNSLTRVVNPYSYFGRPDIWPRGYPLAAVNVSENQKVISVPKGKPTPRPLVQQGLADLDPDVDAVFRLTRPDALPHVHFEEKEPVIIAPGVAAPYNAQNTVYHYDALWGTIIPSTVTIRVCDIWRGYWVQRLLWDIGGALTFIPATVKQIRNPHNYLLDFEQELPMYMTTETFVKLLVNFEKPVVNVLNGGDTLYSRMKRIGRDMTAAGLWKQHDVDTLDAWIEDLEGLNYRVPQLQPLY